MHGYVDIGDAINWDAPLNRGLLNWLMALPDQQRGVTVRDLRLRNHGTLAGGAAAIGPRGRPGGFGAVFMDGTDDQVNITPFAIPTTRGSMSLWWCPLEARTVASPILGVNKDGGWTDFTIAPFSDSHTYIGFSTSAGGDDRVKVSTPNVTLGTWHQWYATWVSGGVTEAYFDGVRLTPVAQPTVSAVWDTATATQFAIGKDAESAVWGNFLWDDFRVSSEIFNPKAVYEAGRGGYERELNWYRPRVYAPEQAAVTAFPWHYYQQMHQMAG